MVGGTTEQLQFTGSVANIAPSISNCPNPLTLEGLSSPWLIYTMTGINGMDAGGNQTQGLLWGISSVKYNGTIIENQTIFTIGATSGVINNPNGTAQQTGNYEIVVTLEDEGGLIANPCTITASFGTPVNITLQTFIKGPAGMQWQTTWDILNPNIIQITNSNTSGSLSSSVYSVPSSPQMAVSITPIPSTYVLPTAAIYIFKKNAFNEQVITLAPGSTGLVNYIFTNIQANDVYRVEVNYGCIKYSILNTSGQGVVTYNFTNCDGTPGSGTVVEGQPDCICSSTVPTATGNYVIEANDPYCPDC